MELRLFGLAVVRLIACGSGKKPEGQAGEGQNMTIGGNSVKIRTLPAPP